MIRRRHSAEVESRPCGPWGGDRLVSYVSVWPGLHHNWHRALTDWLPASWWMDGCSRLHWRPRIHRGDLTLAIDLTTSTSCLCLPFRTLFWDPIAQSLPYPVRLPLSLWHPSPTHPPSPSLCRCWLPDTRFLVLSPASLSYPLPPPFPYLAVPSMSLSTPSTHPIYYLH